MKSLISRLINDGKISNDHAEGIEEFSNIFLQLFDYSKYKYGSTYVLAEISMSMKEEARNRKVFGIIDDQRDDQGILSMHLQENSSAYGHYTYIHTINFVFMVQKCMLYLNTLFIILKYCGYYHHYFYILNYFGILLQNHHYCAVNGLDIC